MADKTMTFSRSSSGYNADLTINGMLMVNKVVWVVCT